MTTEQLLTAANAFEGRKKLLTTALNNIKSAQKAYARFIKLNQLAREENGILHSLEGFRLHPLVTFSTKEKYERKAMIAKRWSERQHKNANALLVEFLIAQFTVNNLY